MFFSFSLSSQFGKNSSWIMFLEEDTRVKLPKLHEVLKKIDHRKVRTFHTVPNVIKIHMFPLIDVPQSARVEIEFFLSLFHQTFMFTINLSYIEVIKKGSRHLQSLCINSALKNKTLDQSSTCRISSIAYL